MSLVNDMLRDLEERRAAPAERLQLDGLQAVDEAAAVRRERLERLRRGSIWLAAVILIGLLVGLMIGRVVKGVPNLASVKHPVAAASAPAPAPVAAAQVLEVLPQHDARGLVLQLLLDRSVPYQRTEESGAVSLRLPGARLAGEAQHGRVQRDGRSLSWRVEAQGADVQVLLVGMGESLEVRDRLEVVGDRWMLWLEVPLTPPATEPAVELDDLPPATATPAEAELPAWATAPVPAVEAPSPAREAEAALEPEPAVVQPSGPPQVSVTPYRPDALAQARQALHDGDYPRAIRELEALQKKSAGDPDVLRWLARAYLAGGEQQRLLAWLPAQLEQLPQDSELRLLLARTQLQAGDTKGAVATLEQHAPALEQEPTYFALLAASYQQTGQWQESAALYRRLTALRSSQSTWQLGLAIALEQLDQAPEAAHHYRQALLGAGLDDSARRFASERATALGGH